MERGCQGDLKQRGVDVDLNLRRRLSLWAFIPCQVSCRILGGKRVDATGLVLIKSFA